jgi:hypothetical protein
LESWARAFSKVTSPNKGTWLTARGVEVSPDFFGESQTLAQLQHTNIVPIYSIHRVEALQAVCMPYFGSTTLKDVYQDLENQGTLPISGKGLLSTLYNRKSDANYRGNSISPEVKLTESSAASSKGSRKATTPTIPATDQHLGDVGS